ncbi:hypothetical protein B0H10DRAFT_1998717, partial [Mycena sp. CBHHK59/15]
MVIQLLYPNSCSNPEEIRKYNKDFRLGPERVQESRAPCQFPSTLDFAYGGLRTCLTCPNLRLQSRPLILWLSSISHLNCVRSILSDPPLQFGSISSEDLLFTFSLTPSIPSDPMLRLLFRVMLGPGITLRTPTMDDIVPEINYSTAVYHIRDTYLQHIFDSFDKLVAAIHCTGNNHSPRRNGDGLHIPMSLPKQGLKELGTLMPGISLFRGYTSRDLDDVVFQTIAATK